MSYVLLVGGTSGLGQKIAPLLDEMGHVVVSLGSKHLDVTDPKAVEEYFEDRVFDHVVYMPSVNHDAFLHKSDPDKVLQQLMVNLLGFVHVLRYALPGMRKKGGGSIIYFSSILAEKPVFGTGIYAATKAAGERLVEQCALENAKNNVRCNSIRAGYFDGGLTWRIPDEVREKIIQGIPLNRLGTEAELCMALAFLMDNEYVTGMHLKITGGL